LLCPLGWGRTIILYVRRRYSQRVRKKDREKERKVEKTTKDILFLISNPGDNPIKYIFAEKD
jgi:hypothetical protein